MSSSRTNRGRKRWKTIRSGAISSLHLFGHSRFIVVISAIVLPCFGALRLGPEQSEQHLFSGRVSGFIFSVPERAVGLFTRKGSVTHGIRKPHSGPDRLNN